MNHAGSIVSNVQALKRLIQDLQNNPVSQLILTEGTVYGSRYYCVEPVGGNWLDIESWVLDTYGSTQGSIWAEERAPEPQQRWYMNNRRFWFRDRKDRDWFVLRWGS